MSNQLIVSPETEKLKISMELTRLGYNYQSVLQAAEDIQINEHSLDQNYKPLKELRVIVTTIKDMQNPYTAQWKAWNEAKASVFAPLDEILKKKSKEFQDVAERVRTKNEEEKKKEADRLRIAELIANYVMQVSQLISLCQTDTEIVTLEKKIGSEKARKNIYGDQLGFISEKLDSLKPAIDNQKKIIRDKYQLELEMKKAKATGDDQAVLDAMDGLELLDLKLNEAKVSVQEKALESAYTAQAVPVETVYPSTVKPRRSSWETEIEDPELAQKKHPELFQLVTDSDKLKEFARPIIDELKKEKKELWQKDGIKIYLDKQY